MTGTYIDIGTGGTGGGGGGGGSQTLAETLANGNTTGGNNLTQTATDYFSGSDGYTRVNDSLKAEGKLIVKEQTLATPLSGYGKIATLAASGDGYQLPRMAVLLNDGYGVKTLLTCNQEYHYFRTTTDATPTNALTLALSDNAAYTINYEIIGDIISDGYVFRRVSQSSYHRINAGAATQESTTVDSLTYANTGAPVWSAEFALANNNLNLTLTGATSKTIVWSILINYYSRPLL